nr:hypothetical protein Itr_chr08CG18510 [Ipomoea trifida]
MSSSSITLSRLTGISDGGRASEAEAVASDEGGVPDGAEELQRRPLRLRTATAAEDLQRRLLLAVGVLRGVGVPLRGGGCG